MATNKKQQDEKHLKMLRDMVSLPSNKQCFDCHQRGPTYVNMTIGSFVCTSCSGVLRGLNPPHRIKSISMASFTPEEMVFLKAHGNELNRKVYLGLCDSKAWPEPDSRDEQHVREFMVQKYETKRWYVAPTEATKEEAKWNNEAALNNKAQARPVRSSLLGESAPKPAAGPGQSTSASSAPVQVSVPLPGGFKPPPPVSTTQAPIPSSATSGKASSGLDFLGDFGGDPFASSAQSSSSTSGQVDGFADFSNFNSMSSEPPQPPAAAPAPAPAPAPVAHVPLAFPISSTPLEPLTRGQTPTPTATQQPPAQSISLGGGGDRYAALANLDSAFSTPVTTAPSINWGGTEGGSINWGSTAGTAGTPSHNTVGSSWGTASSPINWNSQGSSSSAGAPAASSGFGAPSTASNPFGGVPAAGVTPFSSATSASGINPFGAAAPVTQLPQSGMPGTAPFGGQFGIPGQPSGLGQFTSGQNGGFGVASSPAGYRGAGAFSQQQQFVMPSQAVGGVQPAGGWGHLGGAGSVTQPVANPFMNTTMHHQVPPPSGSTNPFL